jgi:hypothetical protein
MLLSIITKFDTSVLRENKTHKIDFMKLSKFLRKWGNVTYIVMLITLTPGFITKKGTCISDVLKF